MLIKVEWFCWFWLMLIYVGYICRVKFRVQKFFTHVKFHRGSNSPLDVWLMNKLDWVHCHGTHNYPAQPIPQAPRQSEDFYSEVKRQPGVCAQESTNLLVVTLVKHTKFHWERNENKNCCLRSFLFDQVASSPLLTLSRQPGLDDQVLNQNCQPGPIGFERRNPSKRSQQLLVSSYLGQTAEKVKDQDRNRWVERDLWSKTSPTRIR